MQLLRARRRAIVVRKSTQDVEAAVELATAAFARGRPAGCTTAVIANADPEVGRALSSGTRFFKEFRG